MQWHTLHLQQCSPGFTTRTTASVVEEYAALVVSLLIRCTSKTTKIANASDDDDEGQQHVAM